MRRLCLVTVLPAFLVLCCPAARLKAEEPSPQQLFKALREKLALDRHQAQADAARIQAHLQKIQSLQSSLTLPKDQASSDVLQQARARDEEALAKARERIRLSEAALQQPDLAIPAQLQGQVKIRTGGGQWQPLGPDRPISEGDSVYTGSDGSMEVLFANGSAIRLGHSSSFTLQSQTPSEFIGELLFGNIHVNHAPAAPGAVLGQVVYRTQTAVTSIRGTEFELAVDTASGLTHFIPAAGKVELAAVPEKLDRQKLDRWWERAASTQSIAGGYRIALKPASQFRKLSEGKDGAVYELKRGGFHIVPEGPPGASAPRPVFRTPTAVCAVRGTEFAVDIDSRGVSDFMPLAGILEIRAGAKLNLQEKNP